MYVVASTLAANMDQGLSGHSGTPARIRRKLPHVDILLVRLYLARFNKAETCQECHLEYQNTTEIYKNTTVIDLGNPEVENGTLARLGFSGLSLVVLRGLAYSRCACL